MGCLHNNATSTHLVSAILVSLIKTWLSMSNAYMSVNTHTHVVKHSVNHLVSTDTHNSVDIHMSTKGFTAVCTTAVQSSSVMGTLPVKKYN